MRKLTINAGKVAPSKLVFNLIRRGVAAGRFPWPETNWTQYLRALRDSAASRAASLTPAAAPVVQEPAEQVPA